MSFEISEEELLSAMRNGQAKIAQRPPPPKASPAAPSDIDRVCGAIRTLAGVLAERPAPSAPGVNVAAPRVTVTAPAVNLPSQPRAWTVEILERDKYDLIKKLKFTAAP